MYIDLVKPISAKYSALAKRPRAVWGYITIEYLVQQRNITTVCSNRITVKIRPKNKHIVIHTDCIAHLTELNLKIIQFWFSRMSKIGT